MINKYTATRKISRDRTVKVTVERGTYSRNITLDGQDTGVQDTHVVDRVHINLYANGKCVASGDDIAPMGRARLLYPGNYHKAVSLGMVGMVGPAWIDQEAHDAITSAIAEANQNCEKTPEQISLETARAEWARKIREFENSPEYKAEEDFRREFYRRDSDY